MSEQRIDIRYHRWFLAQTDNGKAFKWLKQNFGSECDEAITNLVRVAYLPIALAEAGASRQQVEAEIKKVRDYFNEKLMAALGSCYEGAPHNGLAPSRSNQDCQVRAVPARAETRVALNGTTISPTAAIDPDDDFLELDEDRLMED